MEEQDLLYQFYYQPETNHKFNFFPSSEKSNNLKHTLNCYKEQSNNNRYGTAADTNRMHSISLASLSCCSSKSYIEINDDESTPLLNGGSKLPRKLSANRRWIMLLIFIFFYAVFLIAGSLTFTKLELNEELKERQYFRDVRQGFLMKYPSILGRIFFLFIFSNLRLPKIIYFKFYRICSYIFQTMT